MQILWNLGEANVAGIIDQFSEPKPAFTTVSTVVRILESKYFVGYRKEGRGHIYFPVIEKETYSNQSINKLMQNYFHGSFKSMVSFFVKNNEVSTKELEEILEQINKNPKK